MQDKDIVDEGVNLKGIEENNFWNNRDKIDDYSNYDKLIRSSLYIYVAHREKILRTFADMLDRQNDDGTPKGKIESDIHDLIYEQGSDVAEREDMEHYFKHNLWLIDDKFAYFDGAYSTPGGKSESDIYLSFYGDDPKAPTEIIIIELKSPNKAHNAGKMTEQV